MEETVLRPRIAERQALPSQNTGDQSADFGTTSEGPMVTEGLAKNIYSPTPPTYNQNGESQDMHEPVMDPLSQQILHRTNTSQGVPRLRTQNTDLLSTQQLGATNGATLDKKHSGESPREPSGLGKADKKKGVTFLSRIIGTNKRKNTIDGASDNETDVGDTRLEGMDAQLYVDNFGFSPQVPQPPSYVKMRSKFKKEKEFDRLFLAQVLKQGSDKKSAPAAGSNPAPQSGSAATHNPLWAVEFSKDGKYLATGGQDPVIRVWAVISSAEDRRAHERHESDSVEARHLSAPVFQHKPIREYYGHTGTIMDLSWSKNNFLLSSSMDKTVRLWHISRNENLCTFKHADYVPSIQFHPTDDRFFLAGSLDAKLRLWSIPDKNVAFSAATSDMITAVSFTPDGKTCIAGTLNGLCVFYSTDKLKWQSQLHVKSTRGQNSKGSKITGIHATHWPNGVEQGEVKLLISSNDSRLRVYNFKDKLLEMKFRGHENKCSQIRASFAESSGHIICGSEDRKTYIWSITNPEGEKRDQRPLEIFEAHSSITTCTVIAPTETKQLLSASEDPIYDLCNPPPVTLVSRTESVISSRAPTEAGAAILTTTSADAGTKKPEVSAAYKARSRHRAGNIIVTADYTGSLKVFRQDCAHAKRMKLTETWDTSSLRRAGSKLGRPSSIISRASRSRRDSVSAQPTTDRIMTWRQGISQGSFDSGTSLSRRSASPRKSLARLSTTSSRPTDSPRLGPTQLPENTTSMPAITHKPSMSLEQSAQSNPDSMTRATSQSNFSTIAPNIPPNKHDESSNDSYTRLNATRNPLAMYNGQSWLFWTSRDKGILPGLQPPSSEEIGRPGLDPRASELSQLSRLTSEMSVEEGREGGEGEK